MPCIADNTAGQHTHMHKQNWEIISFMQGAIHHNVHYPLLVYGFKLMEQVAFHKSNSIQNSWGTSTAYARIHVCPPQHLNIPNGKTIHDKKNNHSSPLWILSTVLCTWQIVPEIAGVRLPSPMTKHVPHRTVMISAFCRNVLFSRIPLIRAARAFLLVGFSSLYVDNSRSAGTCLWARGILACLHISEYNAKVPPAQHPFKPITCHESDQGNILTHLSRCHLQKCKIALSISEHILPLFQRHSFSLDENSKQLLRAQVLS